MKYILKIRDIIKDGHNMFLEDVVKDLNRKAYLEGIITDDTKFLKEMKEHFDKGMNGDITEFEYVNQMLNDWIDELEDK